jgi:translation initiation factor RLI1
MHIYALLINLFQSPFPNPPSSPSAFHHGFLDSEPRIVASKVIKCLILHVRKTASVIERDFIMATYLADCVIVFEGRPAIAATAMPPQSLLMRMNKFLTSLEITFELDPMVFRLGCMMCVLRLAVCL